MSGSDGDGVRPDQLHEEARLVRDEETGADTPTAHTVPIGKSSSSNSLSTTNKMDWLVSVMNSSYSNVSAGRSKTGPKIQRVPDLLRKNHKHMHLFEPEVVALGPFHYHNANLKPMDEHKMAATKCFVAESGHSIKVFYNKVCEVASEARKCYANMPELSDEEFVDMMFFDGCFLLHFVHLIISYRWSNLTMCSHLQDVILVDMFLYENQIPFIVLKALMTLKPINLTKFIDMISKSQKPHIQETKEPCHLLDLLRMRLLGPEEMLYAAGGNTWTTFRSVMELKEVGIIFNKSEFNQLRDVEFSNGFVRSLLSLPPIIVDDVTRRRFLNLIAMEMCPDSFSDYGISSYIWLMDRLIDHPEDVKELRSRGILVNALGSDEQVADLFNDMATNLTIAPSAYFGVIRGIHKHYENEYRVSVVRMLNTHFSTTWSTVAFVAGVFITILTVIQTIFTIWPRN